MYSNIFDSHVHSDCSCDGHHSVTFICENAVEKGVSGIAITDHCEIQDYERDQGAMRIRQSAFQARKARSIFQHKLIISAGIELGQPLEHPAWAEEALGLFPFDYVLCSVHNLIGQQDFYWIHWDQYSDQQIHEILTEYFSYSIKTIKWGQFDAFAHILYPLRYICGKYKRQVDLSRYTEAIDELLKTLSIYGKALEINTACYRKEDVPPRTLLPILKRFKQLGGEWVTLGSDAHTADVVGANITDGMELAKEAGFEYFAFFRQRRPTMLKII